MYFENEEISYLTVLNFFKKNCMYRIFFFFFKACTVTVRKAVTAASLTLFIRYRFINVYIFITTSCLYIFVWPSKLLYISLYFIYFGPRIFAIYISANFFIDPFKLSSRSLHDCFMLIYFTFELQYFLYSTFA